MAGGTISTGAHPKLLWPGIHAIWGQTYNEHPMEYPDLYEILDSNQAYEEDVQVTGFQLAYNKPEGDSLKYDSEIQGPVQRYTHLAYALGYKVTFEEQRDDLYEVVSMRRVKANAFSIAQTVENIGARRLYTLMERLLEELSFEAPDIGTQSIKMDVAYVSEHLKDVVDNVDLSRYML